jgi:altronate dehydratase
MSTAKAGRQALLVDPQDNVATALVALAAGQRVAVGEGTVTLAAAIPQGHKFALRAIAAGEPVLKYGQPIGRATAPIAPGEHVHVHNVVTQRGKPKARP